MCTIGLLLLFPLTLTFLWKAEVRALRRQFKLRESQLTEQVTSLLEEKCDSMAKITEQNSTIQQLQKQINVGAQSQHGLQQDNEELQMIAKLFRDENENSREKVKLLKKDISEKEQRIVDLKFIMASMGQDMREKSTKIFALERALVAERTDIVRLRQRLVETTDLLVLLKNSSLALFPRLFVDHQRSRSQKCNNSAIFKDILHELASEDLRISADVSIRPG
ncbi:uncharacterized protein LOC116224078 isoform X2 [Clupea harengus]|nr:uncharacterized protein LOC116224078 isoform X2 [Clupea harengus]